MATITVRKADDGTLSYRVQVRLKGSKPETATFPTRTEAKRWGEKIESDLRTGRHFGEAARRTFDEVWSAYRPKSKDPKRLDFWRSVFGTLSLDQITTPRIAQERDKLLTGLTTRKDAKGNAIPRSGATANRYLAELSTALTYTVKQFGWIAVNPCLRVPKSKESRGRVRFLSDAERTVLLKACRESENKHLYLAVILALSTGARQAEIMSLRYSQIDFARSVIMLSDSKNGEQRALPLVGESEQLLQERARVRRIDDDRVFPPTSRARKSDHLDLRVPWEKALEDAGIVDFHWHDLRHTAASYLAMNGVTLLSISKVLGHRTAAMVSRYSHLSPENIVEIGDKLSNSLGIGRKS